MIKLAWISDCHFDHLRDQEVLNFITEVESQCDMVTISGDIAHYPTTNKYMNMFTKPVYYVLGNHDYYGGYYLKVRSNVTAKTYLTYSNGCLLSDRTAIVGVDGWADARAGDITKSYVRLNDSTHNETLRFALDRVHARYAEKYNNNTDYSKWMSARWKAGQKVLARKMSELSDADTELLVKQLDNILSNEDVNHIIVVTHVPPFEQACVYEGRITGPNFLPFYCNAGLGDTLKNYIRKYYNVKFTILCGHTHNYCLYSIYENMDLRVAKAIYGMPRYEILEVL